jgi:4-hydroxybenzoate polyprenyltransferase
VAQLRNLGRRSTLARLAEDVKFEHSIFALPFAYLGMVLAARGLPTLLQVLWITVAMVAARTLAMAANRLIDRELDVRNPRTAKRALPTGRLTSRQMLLACGASLALFLFAAAQLNPLCLALAPVAAVFVVGYSYTKRLTYLSHVVLGLADAIAPVGGWLAVTGTLSIEPVLLALAVAAWIGGFDVIYACQDVEFDHANGLHSIPARFGVGAALRVSSWMHVFTAVALLALWPLAHLGVAYLVGWAIACALLIHEHRLVRPDDLSKLGIAFFNVNGYIAVVLFAFTFLGLIV